MELGTTRAQSRSTSAWTPDFDCGAESQTDTTYAYELPVTAGGVSRDGYLVPRVGVSSGLPAYYAVTAQDNASDGGIQNKDDDGASGANSDVYYSVPAERGGAGPYTQAHREYLVPQPVGCGTGGTATGFFYANPAYENNTAAAINHVTDAGGASGSGAAAGAKSNTSRPWWRRRSTVAAMLLLLLVVVGVVVGVALATSGGRGGRDRAGAEQGAQTTQAGTAAATSAFTTAAPTTAAPTTTITNTTATEPPLRFTVSEENSTTECVLQVTLPVPSAAPQGWTVTITQEQQHEGVISTWGGGYETTRANRSYLLFNSLSSTADLAQNDTIFLGMHLYNGGDGGPNCPGIQSIDFATKPGNPCTNITALDTTGLDLTSSRYFGQHVGAAPPRGRFLFVGAPGAGANDGAVLVYRRDRFGQFPLTTIVPGAADKAENFGRSLAMATTDRIVVGTKNAVGIFTVAASSGKLATDRIVNDPVCNSVDFGAFVAATGDWVVAGQPKCTMADTTVGAVFVWRRNKTLDGFPRLPGTILYGTGDVQGLGSSVAIEGLWLAAGASRSQAIMIARYDMTQNTWAESQVLTSENVPAEGALGSGGLVLAAPWLAAGAPGMEADYSGRVLLFRLLGNNWVERTVLMESDDGAMFGASLAVYGRVLAVGAPQEMDSDTNASAQGRVIVYHLAQLDEEPYAVRQPISIFGQGGKLGSSIAIGGNALLAGAPYADVGDQVESGLAHLQCI